MRRPERPGPTTFTPSKRNDVAEPEPSVLVARTPDPLVPPPNTSPNWYRRRS